MRSLARTYKRLPLLNGTNAIADAIRVNGLNVLIGASFGQAALGHYGLAWRTTLLPASLINGALGQLYYQKLARTVPGRMTSTALRFAALSGSIAVLPFGVLWMYAEPIFTLAFGSDWETAGVIASKLAPWLALTFVTAPLSTIFIVTNRQGRALLWAIAAAAVPITIIATSDGPLLAMIDLLAFAMSATMLAYLALIFFTARAFDKGTEPSLGGGLKHE